MQVETVKVGEILAPVHPDEEHRREARVRSGFFATVKRAMRHVPFMEDVAASYYCAIDPQTPSASKGILLAALAYFVMPFDIVPDFLLGLGFTDDVAVLLAAVQAVRTSIRPEHYDKARQALTDLETEH
ncbi:YkvA family protein [Aureimonas sp. Leaf454]|uniref:YkvA family protein n=1 Tax=Aureimonas sp. Leaf454 TaxID=1736381 RepID=UPI0009E9E167|nr:YkvA family protein [Aureimonas sp. Leaf454]